LLGYLKGGIILSQEQLRFSVEESVWFQKGQEVSELLSISLDPDISIHEHDQYISIRGALQLTGEYKIDNEVNGQDQFEYANVRYVNEVNTREDGVSILNHRFPVDITIPSERIENLEEVYVSIESFDYEIPELKCLKLIADLSISGISNEQSQPVTAEVERQEEETFEALYRAPQNETIEAENEPSSQFQHSTAQPFSSFFQEADTADEDVDKLSTANTSVEVEEEVRKEENAVEKSTTPSLEETNHEDSESKQVEEDIQNQGDQDDQDQQEDLYDPFVVEVRKQEQETVEPQEVQYSFFSKSEGLASSENQDESEEESEREENDPKDTHYLTSLFARDEDEDFSRLKMCIVQQGDTLDLICERYDISVQQILRVNDVHADQDVYEGQILYIPAYSTSK
jgi:stage VI sporulation protein D